MRRKGKHIAFVLAAGLLFGACSDYDGECRQSTGGNLRMTCRVLTTDTLGQSVVSSMQADTLSISGLGSDSVLYTSHQSAFALPLNRLEETTAYVLYFQLHDTTRVPTVADTVTIITSIDALDTLTFHYTNQLQYLSLECGCYVTQLLDSVSVTRHAVDSVAILNQAITTDSETNLEIYLR